MSHATSLESNGGSSKHGTLLADNIAGGGGCRGHGRCGRGGGRPRVVGQAASRCSQHALLDRGRREEGQRGHLQRRGRHATGRVAASHTAPRRARRRHGAAAAAAAAVDAASAEPLRDLLPLLALGVHGDLTGTRSLLRALHGRGRLGVGGLAGLVVVHHLHRRADCLFDLVRVERSAQRREPPRASWRHLSRSRRLGLSDSTQQGQRRPTLRANSSRGREKARTSDANRWRRRQHWGRQGRHRRGHPWHGHRHRLVAAAACRCRRRRPEIQRRHTTDTELAVAGAGGAEDATSGRSCRGGGGRRRHGRIGAEAEAGQHRARGRIV
mmetsp:Transcript_75149/g.215243  ORF Transcript_75149/g.215243 Transcript_75149/m.215243 type:complete len:326 (+) Transcript_75149:100-1077(+)